ncbi:hypothetical protein UCDDS831_g07875 [Diplodia seriata]|uniref:Uncharacterized protein n=1 Tax=Diplodia seriata TaxID=420778 RepID=A0A0G2FSX5_9PEZI|nr:hypothetical protein UCDDS831_g07875 [Diplodia seriata]
MSGGAGEAIGVLGLVMAFKGAADAALWIESFFNDAKEGCGYLALSYHIEKTRLQVWGELYKVNDDTISSQSPLRHRPDPIKELIVHILGQIRKLDEKANTLVEKHRIGIAPLPGLGLDDDLGQHIRTLANIKVKPRNGFLWTLKRKTEFKEVVSNIRKLVGDLRELSQDFNEQVFAEALPSHALASVNDPELLKEMAAPGNNFERSLASSALAKSLYQDESQQQPSGSPTRIRKQQLKFLTTSPEFGILTRPDGNKLTVWIEWNTFAAGGEWREYAKRIDKLGYFLEQVSNPALCLPPCYGVFDDSAYEMASGGAKRIGFIFGPPQNATPHPYDSNLPDYPPTTLRKLIKGQDTASIPSLGDRFHLALALAAAFSRFHAAGWLHKGFHSGSIVFLHRVDERGVSITEPFITGFQYSRPQLEQSLPQGPLDNKELQHYYHPDAHDGFTKQRDLYSLGVVLCEIGRWRMVTDLVSERRRAGLDNRAAWQRYLVDVVAQDLEWRVGTMYKSVVMTLLQGRLPSLNELFVKQYLEKVILPLSKCNV